MSIELVIARYNEDVSWLNSVKNMKITIYNKGDDNLNKKNIKLPNIGRESHTYLTHIINNYDNLADITIFCQGDPFFHSPDFLDIIKKAKYFEPIQPLTYYYSPSLEEASNNEKKIIINKQFRINGMPPTEVLEKSKDIFQNKFRIYVEYYNKYGIVMYPKYYRDYFIISFIKYLKRIFNFKNIVQFMRDRYKIYNLKEDILNPMSYAAIFSVSKEVIKSRTKKFYQNILDLLLDDKIKYNVDTGLLLERLWLSIFNYQKYNKHYIKLKAKDFKINYYEVCPGNNEVNISIKTISPLYIIIEIDKIKYFLIIGFNDIFFRKYNRKIFLNKKIENILNQKEYTVLNITLNKKLKIKYNNKLLVDTYIDEKKIDSVKIEKTYLDIK